MTQSPGNAEYRNAAGPGPVAAPATSEGAVRPATREAARLDPRGVRRAATPRPWTASGRPDEAPAEFEAVARRPARGRTVVQEGLGRLLLPQRRLRQGRRRCSRASPRRTPDDPVAAAGARLRRSRRPGDRERAIASVPRRARSRAARPAIAAGAPGREPARPPAAKDEAVGAAAGRAADARPRPRCCSAGSAASSSGRAGPPRRPRPTGSTRASRRTRRTRRDDRGAGGARSRRPRRGRAR